MWILNRFNFIRLQDGGWFGYVHEQFAFLPAGCCITKQLRKMENSGERENNLIVLDVKKEG